MELFTENCCKVMFKARARPAQGPRKAPTQAYPQKTSVSQMIDLVMRIQTVQESSKSELSSRFLSTSKFGPPRKTSAQGHARLFAQGQGWLIVSINYCSTPAGVSGPQQPSLDPHGAVADRSLHDMMVQSSRTFNCPPQTPMA